MTNYKIIVSYDGTDYAGWQRLNGKNTVQGALERALSSFVGTNIEILGASRTDAGVHALAQCANFKLEKEIPVDVLKDALNSRLSKDIACFSCEIVNERFHARFNVVSKTYRYRILNTKLHDPFLRNYAYHESRPLDIKKIKQASSAFVGTHNFQTFTNLKEKDKSFERTIKNISVSQNDTFIDIEITADGFLHNQVRIMAHSLLQAGLGEITTDEISALIKLQDRSKGPEMLQAKGLYLVSVLY